MVVDSDFDFSLLGFDDLVDVRNAADEELKNRAQKELAELELAKSKLVKFIGLKDPSDLIFDAPVKAPADPKYRDPATGKTWSGKGKRPFWFDADRADDFLIERE